MEDMTKETAFWILNESALETIGVNADGDEVEKSTSFGKILLGRGVPTCLGAPSKILCAWQKENASEIASFLRDWAYALDGKLM